MPPRASFKSDSSFFEKVVIGVVGAEAVRQRLAELGHAVVELERGALDPKLWKEVKRKRVRIPDLVCTRCGRRIESRAKTRPELSMSHSPSDPYRSWDSGMIPGDWIAFPICEPAVRKDWVLGQLIGGDSYWHERRWAHWRSRGAINVFGVASFRGSNPKPKPVKGVTEGSETQVFWPAAFSAQDGIVTRIDVGTIRYARDQQSRERSVRISGGGRAGLRPVVASGEAILLHQVLAAAVPPISQEDLTCPNDLAEEHIAAMLRSRQQTVRYTGCRLAKLCRIASMAPLLFDLAKDPAEDLYTRLEARSYLLTVRGEDAQEQFGEFLVQTVDPSWRLESIVTLADTPSVSAMRLLESVLADLENPFFLRSAAAWALGHFPERDAAEALVRTFSDIDLNLRQEAVTALVHTGISDLSPLLEGLSQETEDIAAGCFEVLRRLGTAPVKSLVDLTESGRSPQWSLWLLASLPKAQVGPVIASWQASRPDLHFALSVLWSFLESWVSEIWEKNPSPQYLSTPPL